MIEVLLVACVILFFTILNRINSQSRKINERFAYLEDLLKQERARHHAPEPVTPLVPEAPPVRREESVIPPPAPIEKPVASPVEKVREPEPVVFQQERIAEVYKAAEPQPSWWEKFKTQNPDLEKFVGENLISKIGIAVLVLGIAFFVKYAIDKNWINEVARVGIGILSGAIVNLVAHKLRTKFKAFSSVLVAGAIAIYYFTIAIGFQEYHIFSQAVAFTLMIVITAFSLLVSLSYNREELALLSLLGGFATPLMVSTGTGNYIILFSYLLILDTGILVLAFARKWNKVNICTFAFTVLFYVSWLVKVHAQPAAPFGGAFIFASLFYMVFTVMILINDTLKRRPAGNLELAIFLGNTALYYSIGMYLLQTAFPRFAGIYTAAMAIVNMAIGWVLYKRFNADKKLVYLLVGLALTFVTLAAPVQLDGNHITLFWAAESVLLLWLSLKSELRNFLLSSMIVSGLMICSLLIDWLQYYTGLVSAELPLVFNNLFLTGCFACACIFAKIILLKRHSSSAKLFFVSVDPAIYGALLRTVAIILLYFVFQIELNYQLRKTALPGISINIALGAFHMLFFTVLTIYMYHRKSASVMAAFTMALVNAMAYAVILCTMHQLEIRDSVAQLRTDTAGFRIHFISLACVAVMVYYAIRIMTYHADLIKGNSNVITWLLATIIVYTCSAELMLNYCYWSIDAAGLKSPAISPSIMLYRLQLQAAKTGFPILWGLLSILFLVYGIRKQNKDLRIFALVLQAVTIIKLFTFDITNVSEAGKIVAFILLGIVLLIMSFMYQKIKAIIFNDETGGTA